MDMKNLKCAGIDFKSCEKNGKIRHCSQCSEYRHLLCEAEVNGLKPPAKKSHTNQPVC